MPVPTSGRPSAAVTPTASSPNTRRPGSGGWTWRSHRFAAVVDAAVLWATGVDERGYRDILGVSVELSEAEVHWRRFLGSLVERGLHGVELFIADDHAGLRVAHQTVFPSIPWQRCQFHLQQNAAAYVPRKAMRREVADAIRAIFNAPNRDEALRLLDLTATTYEPVAPRLAAWMRDDLPEGLAVFDFPAAQRRRLRTTNVQERCNKEIRRRR